MHGLDNTTLVQLFNAYVKFGMLAQAEWFLFVEVWNHDIAPNCSQMCALYRLMISLVPVEY